MCEEQKMINRVVLAGRPTRDLELRNTESGASVCSFTLAVDRNFKNKNGERKADFISCIAWKKTAEVMSKYVKKRFCYWSRRKNPDQKL